MKHPLLTRSQVILLEFTSVLAILKGLRALALANGFLNQHRSALSFVFRPVKQRPRQPGEASQELHASSMLVGGLCVGPLGSNSHSSQGRPARSCMPLACCWVLLGKYFLRVLVPIMEGYVSVLKAATATATRGGQPRAGCPKYASAWCECNVHACCTAVQALAARMHVGSVGPQGTGKVYVPCDCTHAFGAMKD
eukprot:scaffold42977_cov21-Tisochrysis_lutea.AAC.3